MARKETPPLNSAQRMAKTRERRIEAGFKQINVWIPAGDTEKVRAYVAKLVKAYGRG